MPTRDERSLGELMRIVRARTTRASDLIAETDDPEIVEREFRYVRPFWEFYVHRTKVNAGRFWNRVGQEAFPDAPLPWVHKNPLAWLPRRSSLAAVTADPAPRVRRLLVRMLNGLDGAVFNFVGLTGRMRHTLGLGDDESFHLVTTEPGGDGFQLQYRLLSRSSPGGRSYRIITCQFELPTGERLKIERDYSEPGDVGVSVRLSAGATGSGIGFDGRAAELKAGRGGEVRAG